jgi:diguanylate cyclase (GGDEF)-like protein
MARATDSLAVRGVAPTVPTALWSSLRIPVILAVATTVAVLGLAAANPPGALWALPGIEAACALVCLGRAVVRPAGRLGWLGLGLGMGAWAAGDLVYAAMPDLGTPSVADVLWLAFYPTSYAGIVILARHRLAGAGAAVWLDGLVVALAAGAGAAALVVGPVAATSEGSRAAVAVNLAYPTGDLVLASLVVLVLSVGGWRLGGRWMLLGGGLLLTAVADGIYLVQYTEGVWVDGTVIDGLWPLAMVMLAGAALLPSSEASERPGTGLLLIAGPALGATGALALLALGETRPLPTLAAALALGALAAVSLRMGVTFVENQRMMEGLRLRATTDPLTGLPNHGEFHHRLGAEVERARRNRRALNLAVIDLDHFKRVNDRHGHPAGDRALRAVADLLRRHARAGDTLGRLGGEEFGWILPEGEDLDAWRAVERARVALEGLDMAGLPALTFSAGVCGLVNVPPSLGARELMRRTDAALYAAKAGGRNAVVRYAPEVGRRLAPTP